MSTWSSRTGTLLRVEGTRQPLTRDRILDAALEAAGKQGLDGLSMRRIARELGVEAMSLYNHVPNKAAIVTGILERALTAIPIPGREAPWDDRLRTLARGMFETFAAHPILATLITTGAAAPSSLEALRPIDELFAALYEAGFDDHQAAQAANALTALIFGSAQLHPLRTADPEAAHTETAELRHHLADSDLTHLRRALSNPRPPNPSADFTDQLNLLLAGLRSTRPG